MSDKERLITWMNDNHITAAKLARATGDHRVTIHHMTRGDREINQAFKWRFGEAFGFDVAKQIFADTPSAQPEIATELEAA